MAKSKSEETKQKVETKEEEDKQKEKVTEEKEAENSEERNESEGAKTEETSEKKSEKEQEEEEKIDLSEEMKTVVETIENMNVMELSNLVKVLEKKFGVSATPAMAPAAGPTDTEGEGTGGEEEKDIFDVVLSEVGSKKIQVIKEIRAMTTLGLKEAKDLVESVPKAVKEALPKEEAEEVKKKLEDVGATVELK